MDKIFILDAVNYLYRSYYAIGPMTNDKGQSTSALYGFIRSIQKLQKEFSFHQFIAVFDGPENIKGRQSVYAEYKTHRKKAPDDLYPQIDYAIKYCELAGIPSLAIPEIEADDTMASIAYWAKNNHLEAYICTSDKDLYQMVDDHVFVLNAHKNNLIIDAKKVEEFFQVTPSQMLDLLAIMGDTSDNIPGIEGFGPKTAAALLQQFGSLDNILANIEKVKGEKKQKLLKEQKEQALLSKKLATLDLTAPIPKDINFYKPKPPNTKKLEEFYHEMKFLRLLEEKPSSLKESSQSKTYIIINDEKSLVSLIDSLKSEKEICIDTETTSIKPLEAKLVGVGLCIHPHKAFYIPVNGNIELHTIIKELKRLVEDQKISFYGHNLKYDLHVLENYNIEIKNISFDTILASYLLNPHNRRHNLDRLALENFNFKKISFDSLVKQDKKKTISILAVPLENMKEYCCEDVDVTCQLKNLFSKQLLKEDLLKVLNEIELPILPILAKMETNGIFIDKDWFSNLSEKWSEQLNKIKQEIFLSVKKEFNLNSPKQLSIVLYDELQLPQPRKKNLAYSTAAPILEELAKVCPIVKRILDYRSLQKLLSTYVDALPKQINPKTNRIHATFNQSITATGRLSCKDPNLQNIPIKSSEGMKIRHGFIPERKNWSYLSADYSQIELRLLAHFSEDEKLIKAFENNEDIHAFTASLIFDIPLDKVTKDMRNKAKTVNFGILYGQGPFGLSQQLGISQKEANEFIKKYFIRYPSISNFLEKCKKQAEETAVATTLFGRKRPIVEIHNKNPQIKAAAQRLAINTPLQGTAADIIKLSMIAISKKIQKDMLSGFMILQIHDELIFEVPDNELDTFISFVKEKMENIVRLKVPLLVDIAIGKNWGEC